MNPFLFVFFIAVLFYYGLSFMRSGNTNSRIHGLNRFFIAACLSAGFSAQFHYIWSAFAGQFDSTAAAVAVATAAAVSLAFRYRFRKRQDSDVTATVRVSMRNHLVMTTMFLFALAFVMSLMFFVVRSLHSPHGHWDAWAIWNMRARFLFRGGEDFMRAFSPLYGWSHPDYPLLVPGLVAALWSLAGESSQAVPMMVGGFFTFITPLITFFGLSKLHKPANGALAGIILLGTSHFLFEGVGQKADVPLGCYILSVFVLCALGEEDIRGKGVMRGGYFVVTGILCGFAAWTKNEGILFALLFFVIYGSVRIKTDGFCRSTKPLALLLAGMLPPLAVLFHFKLFVAPPTDLFTGRRLSDVASLLVMPERYMTVIGAFFSEFSEFLKARFIVFIGCPLFLGFSCDEKAVPVVKTALFTIAILLTGYFMVYILTPNDLAWHLHTSLRRLFLHVYPAFVFAFFLVLSEASALWNKAFGGIPLPRRRSE